MSLSHEDGAIRQSDRAYGILVQKIATCQLKPGSLFNEREAAAALGMSRTPFRQALHRLALEGLVVTVPKKGVYVTLLDFETLEDNLIVRQALEVEAIHQVLERGVTLDFKLLTSLLQEMKTASGSNDVVGFLNCDEQFHFAIMRALGNSAAIEAVQRTWVHLNRARYLLPPSRKSRTDAIAEHHQILSALREGDLSEAERSVRHHMHKSLERLRSMRMEAPSMFSNSAPDAPPAQKALIRTDASQTVPARGPSPG